MAETRVQAHAPGADRHSVKTKTGRSPYWSHFFQMLAAMAVGMIVTGAIFLSIVGLKTWDEVTVHYPMQALLAMAVGMTVPMAAWMVHRGMGHRNAYEMSAVMLAAVTPFLLLVWFGLTESAQCGWYCLLTVLGMLALMRYRREVYSAHDAPEVASSHSWPDHGSRGS